MGPRLGSALALSRARTSSAARRSARSSGDSPLLYVAGELLLDLLFGVDEVPLPPLPPLLRRFRGPAPRSFLSASALMDSTVSTWNLRCSWRFCLRDSISRLVFSSRSRTSLKVFATKVSDSTTSRYSFVRLNSSTVSGFGRGTLRCMSSL